MSLLNIRSQEKGISESEFEVTIELRSGLCCRLSWGWRKMELIWIIRWI